MRSFPFPQKQAAYTSRKTASSVKGAADFLQGHDKMASLLPTATRMAALIKDCTAILPAVFDTCSVLQFEAGQLVLAMPNAALAAKLKQQIPKLQENLLKRGWQVNAIRLKVQVMPPLAKNTPIKQLELPNQALASLAALEQALETSPRNANLKAALHAMLQRHKR